jgi:hypothetical protein
MSRRFHSRVLLIAVGLSVLALAREAGAQALLNPPTKTNLADLAKTDTAKKLWDGLLKIKDINDQGDSYYKDLDALSKEDEQFEPDYELPGTPDLPSVCKDSSKCAECFEPAYAELQNTRFRFEKLRRLNRVTKTMLRDALSFGDAAASAAGGIAGLAWAKEKAKIRTSEKSFNASHDAKYVELLATLEKSLRGIAECEEKVFGNEGWYDRYGFFYHAFMAEAYRRPD